MAEGGSAHHDAGPVGYAGYFQDPDGHLWEVPLQSNVPASRLTVAREDVCRPLQYCACDGEPNWPSPSIELQAWRLGPRGLTQAPQPYHRVDLPSILVIGGSAGEFMPIFSSARGPELPGEQSREDRCSLVFDSAPLGDDIDMIGAPRLLLELETDEPTGQIVVRLCEVAPDGRSRLSWPD
jgi:predicted acyl esterase